MCMSGDVLPGKVSIVQLLKFHPSSTCLTVDEGSINIDQCTNPSDVSWVDKIRCDIDQKMSYYYIQS